MIQNIRPNYGQTIDYPSNVETSTHTSNVSSLILATHQYLQIFCSLSLSLFSFAEQYVIHQSVTFRQ